MPYCKFLQFIFCWPCICLSSFFKWVSSPTQTRDSDPEIPSQRVRQPPPNNQVEVPERTDNNGSHQKKKTLNNVSEEVGKYGTMNESVPPDPSSYNGNNQNDNFLEEELESMKKPPETVEKVSERNDNIDIENYEKQMKQINPNDSNFEKQKEELTREAEKQKENFDSWKVIDETETFEESEYLKKEEERFQNELEKQNQKHKEEMEKIRRRREDKQRQFDDELNEMKMEFQQRMRTFILCCQLKIRFEEKEEEWGDHLKGFREPLIKVIKYYPNLQDEFRESRRERNDGSEVAFRAKLFANVLETAQYYLAESFVKLIELSEKHDDRIFLRMIMKSLSSEAMKCDSIGYKLIDLMMNPLEKNCQNELNDLVSKMDSHSIPTTTNLKERAKTERMEDYLDIVEAPFPEWFNRI